MATIHKLTKDGATIFPATITDAVVHPQTGKTLTSMMKDYNVSELFPTEGIDGGNKYNLALAIQVLGTHLSAAQKTGGIKLTFISSVFPYPEEEYYLGKSSWSGNASDWDQRFEVGDVVADPSGSWEPSTAQQYIDQQVGTINSNLTSETIARQNGDRNLQTNLTSEMNTRASQDANLNALINAGIREGGGVEFDIVPTQNSANGITSGGMYSTLRDPNIGFVDDEPIAGSNNLVKSGGVAEVIDTATSNILELQAVTRESEILNYTSQSSGYMLDNGTITQVTYYYHRIYSVAQGNVIYLVNNFGGTTSNHHVLFLDSSDNIIETKYKGNVNSLTVSFFVPENSVKMVVNYSQRVPVVRLVSNASILSQELKDSIAELNTKHESLKAVVQKQDKQSPNNDAVGFMKDDGTINPMNGYHNRDYNVVANDVLYVKNVFNGSTGNHHLIYLDGSNNVVKTEFLGNTNKIESLTTVPLSATKLVVNSYLNNVPDVRKVSSDIIFSQDLLDRINQIPGYWEGKKWVVLGDSLTALNVRTDIHYFDYIREKTGVTVENLAVSGSGYKKLEELSAAFYQKANTVPIDADIVTIFGSFNDLAVEGYTLGGYNDTGTNTMCGCINTTLDTILTRFMNAGKVPVIGVITPTPWQNYLPSSTDQPCYAYVEAIINCCKRRSIPVLDLFKCSNLHPADSTFRTLAYSKDDGGGVHPDETGHKIIAPMIHNFVSKLLL